MAATVTARPAHGRRFGLVYLGLAAVVGAAVGSSIVLGERGTHRSEAWSTWHPTAPPEVRANEIAAHVADAYQLAAGQRLVDVVTGPPPNASVLTEIATPPAGAGLGQRTPTYDASRSRLYILCGAGKNCSPTSTVPTLLLRREALELALYTFKYVGDAESVVTFLPGTTTQAPRNALFFRRKDLGPQLSHPLDTTLDQSPSATTEAHATAEARRVQRLMGPHLFRFQIAQTQGGAGLLMLNPLNP
jgi:hypothetical protein